MGLLFHHVVKMICRKEIRSMRILITGGNRGLGSALVKVALEEGNDVIATYRKDQGELENYNSDKLLLMKCDVSDEKSVVELSERIKEEGSLDVIVNNAGIHIEREAGVKDLDLEAVAFVLEVNALGPVRVVKHLLDTLLEGNMKKILNISSEAGSLKHSYATDYPYGMSKVALNMFGEKLHHELKDQGVEVYSVHPGWMRTDMGGKEAHLSPEASARTIYNTFIKGKQQNTQRFLNADGTAHDF